MDIPIEIAWICIGVCNLSNRFSLKVVSGVVILVELIVIFFMIKIIDRFVPWVLTPGMKSAKD